MFYKSRTECDELTILRSLNTRMNLPEKDKQHFFNLKKGYEGELQFDCMTEKLQSECYVLNDLLLNVNNTIFQIDSLIIFPESIHFFEVKNYEGDYYYESDRMYKKSKVEINNPLTQLTRSESLLRQLLQTLGYKYSLNASVVFINPDFYLYQALLNKPFIFPTQINKYLKKLDACTAKLDRKHQLLADKLVSLHIHESPYSQLPTYDYEQLQKGITCDKCGSFSISVKGKKCVCAGCGHEELVDDALMRSVSEFKMLFPDRKIMTNVVYDWCRVVESKKRISRILGKNFTKIGTKRWVYFE